MRRKQIKAETDETEKFDESTIVKGIAPEIEASILRAVTHRIIKSIEAHPDLEKLSEKHYGYVKNEINNFAGAVFTLARSIEGNKK